MNDNHAPPVVNQSASASAGCCCGPGPQKPAPEKRQQPFVCGVVETAAGPIPRVGSSLGRGDRWGTLLVRWGVGRMDYTVDPGLYALGEPDQDSEVLVSANYKLSFDQLRQAMAGHNVWLLVLDTDGINVWCAAGHGSFGTAELVQRIESSSLAEVVSHRRLIVPQLGAPGVAAHEVKKQSRFKVVWGPIRAQDLPAFLAAGRKATPMMRTKQFPFRERLALVPVELVIGGKPIILVMLGFFFLAGLGGPGGYWANAATHGLSAVLAILGGVFAGGALTPLLLPFLPGRAFAVKGLWPGLLVGLAVAWLRSGDLGLWPDRLEMAALLILSTVVATFLAMNFTGASTYTSLSGVIREMRFAVRLQIVAAVLGIGLLICSRLMA